MDEEYESFKNEQIDKAYKKASVPEIKQEQKSAFVHIPKSVLKELEKK